MCYQTFLIEYSPSQDAFHIESLTERLFKNIDMINRGVSSDYTAVGTASTREQANHIVNYLRKHHFKNGVLEPCRSVKSQSAMYLESKN